MNSRKYLSIIGSGIITSIGGDTQSSLAAIVAGISRGQETSFYSKKSTSLKMNIVPKGVLPPINENLLKLPISYKQRRMLCLANVALNEVLSFYKNQSSPIPLFLALPESIPNCPTSLTRKFLDYLVTQTNANIDMASSNIIAYGRAAGHYAIDLAFKFIEATGEKYVLIGGVDTYVDLKLLGYLDQENRVLSDGIMDGFTPSEGASFLLLSSDDIVNAKKQYPRIYSPGFGEEKGHRYSKEVYKGDGLASAFSSAFQNNAPKIESIYSSQNGESIGAKELGVALIRNNKVIADEYKIEHPADCFGDIGAATGPALMALAAYKGKKMNLVYCSSDNGQRSALCVSRS